MTVTTAEPGTRQRVGMQVSKRDGDTQPVDVNKIVRAVQRCAGGLAAILGSGTAADGAHPCRTDPADEPARSKRPR